METPCVFDCRGDGLVGIVHGGASTARVGVLIVTGGPQYRAGSHRQFVLLARRLAAHGVPAFRFDTRGMGDSEGEFPGFDALTPDIAAAVDCFFRHQPELEKVVLWGLCDAATAAAIYLREDDDRVGGVVLLNPWVRTETGQAKTLLTNYYGQRLLSREFWRNLLTGRFAAGKALRSLAGNLRRASSSGDAAGADAPHGAGYIASMARGLQRFGGPVLLVISGDDLTAAEFLRLKASSPAWAALFERPNHVSRECPAANHTFSSEAWRREVEDWTLEFLKTNNFS